jgi:hypothetical protein
VRTGYFMRASPSPPAPLAAGFREMQPGPVGGCALAGEWRSRRGALSRPAQAGCLLIPPGHWLALGAGLPRSGRAPMS